MKLAKIGAAAFAVVMTAAIVPTASYAAMEETLVEARVQPVAEVRYGDLNLRTAAGVEQLQSRIRRAAVTMCVDHGSRNLRRIMESQDCRDAALESAAPQVTAAIARAGTEQLASNAKITLARP